MSVVDKEQGASVVGGQGMGKKQKTRPDEERREQVKILLRK